MFTILLLINALSYLFCVPRGTQTEATYFFYLFSFFYFLLILTYTFLPLNIK